MKITMDGKYATRGNPNEQVRILCVDRPDLYSVVYIGKDASLYTTLPDGGWLKGKSTEYDLIPYDPPLEGWVVVGNQGGVWYGITPDKSRAMSAQNSLTSETKVIYVKQVTPPESP